MLLYIIYIFTIGISLIYLYQSRLPDEVPISVSHSDKLVSIIVPARNEERNIRRCLQSLVDLEYSNTEIILVDGNSTDNTVEIASSFEEIRIISEPERPDGWVGKPWACYTGYQEAKGDILLFTDADTWHDPRSLDTTVTELDQSDGFLTFLTTQEFRSFWEHMLAIVFLIISITVRGTKGTDRAQIANGQYMMFDRDRYEDLGTHEVVADSIIEDLAFGTHGAKQGYPPVIAAHHNLVTARMYRSLADIREGFGKNLGLGVDQAGIDSIISAGFITAWALGWLLILLVEVATGTAPTILQAGILVGGYLSFALLLFVIESNVSSRGTFYVLVYPIYFIVFEVIVIQSLVHTFITKEIVWKDQSYNI